MSISVQEVQPVTIPTGLIRPDRLFIKVEAHGDSNAEFGDSFWSFNICDPDCQADISGTLRVIATSRQEYVNAVYSWFLQGCQRLGFIVCGFQDLGSWHEDKSNGPSILMMFDVTRA